MKNEENGAAASSFEIQTSNFLIQSPVPRRPMTLSPPFECRMKNEEKTEAPILPSKFEIRTS